MLNTKDKDLNSDVALRLREEILAKQREMNEKLV